MKDLILVGAMLVGNAITASSWAAEAASPDIFQVRVEGVIPAGSNTVQAVSLVTTPANKRLVIQSVSFYEIGGSPGSSARVYLATSIFNINSFWAVPEAYEDGLAYPGTTLSATIYAGGATNVNFNAYRTGDLTSEEDVYVSVSGYYVAKP